MDLSKIHGRIYKYKGPLKLVVINDLQIARETFEEKKNENEGRSYMSFS